MTESNTAATLSIRMTPVSLLRTSRSFTSLKGSYNCGHGRHRAPLAGQLRKIIGLSGDQRWGSFYINGFCHVSARIRSQVRDLFSPQDEVRQWRICRGCWMMCFRLDLLPVIAMGSFAWTVYFLWELMIWIERLRNYSLECGSYYWGDIIECSECLLFEWYSDLIENNRYESWRPPDVVLWLSARTAHINGRRSSFSLWLLCRNLTMLGSTVRVSANYEFWKLPQTLSSYRSLDCERWIVRSIYQNFSRKRVSSVVWEQLEVNIFRRFDFN